MANEALSDLPLSITSSQVSKQFRLRTKEEVDNHPLLQQLMFSFFHPDIAEIVPINVTIYGDLYQDGEINYFDGEVKAEIKYIQEIESEYDEDDMTDVASYDIVKYKITIQANFFQRALEGDYFLIEEIESGLVQYKHISSSIHHFKGGKRVSNSFVTWLNMLTHSKHNEEDNGEKEQYIGDVERMFEGTLERLGLDRLKVIFPLERISYRDPETEYIFKFQAATKELESVTHPRYNCTFSNSFVTNPTVTIEGKVKRIHMYGYTFCLCKKEEEQDFYLASISREITCHLAMSDVKEK